MFESQNDDDIGDEGAKAIAQAIKENTRVHGLYLVRLNVLILLYFLRMLCCFVA